MTDGEFINSFLVPFSRGHRLSKEGDRALKLCTLLAFPPPPPGSVVQNVDLPPHLEAVGPEQLSEVVLDLAEGYAKCQKDVKLSKRCQVVKKMSSCQKEVKYQKVKHADYGGGSQKK